MGASRHARSIDASPADHASPAVACLLPAWRSGERRVRVSGSLCPELAERVKTPMGMLSAWFPDDFGPPPAVEPADGWETRSAVAGRSVQMLSCGIDSLATLRWNTSHVPRSHQDAISACVYFEIDEDPTGIFWG